MSVTRETIIEFSHPVAARDAIADAVFAQFGGRVLDARVHLSPSHKIVTLFYTEPLPASARVRVTIDGDLLLDDLGQPVDADPGQVVYFDNQGAPNEYLRWRAVDEDGTVIFENHRLDHGTLSPEVLTLDRGGTYTITVAGIHNRRGAYQFQVWDVPAPDQFAITIGDTVSDGAPGSGAGNLETPGVWDVYTFEANPGQVVYFDNQGAPNEYLNGGLWMKMGR